MSRTKPLSTYEIIQRAAAIIAERRDARANSAPMADARAVLAEVAPLIEARVLANAPDGTHCRSCCYLESPCDEHKV